MYSFHIFFRSLFCFCQMKRYEKSLHFIGFGIDRDQIDALPLSIRKQSEKNRYTHFFSYSYAFHFKKKMGTNEAKSQYAFEKKGIWKEKARWSIGTRKKQKETNSTQCHVYDIPISSLYPLNPHTFHVHRSKLLRASTQIKRLTFDVDCTFRESIFFSLRSRISNGIQCKG